MNPNGSYKQSCLLSGQREWSTRDSLPDIFLFVLREQYDHYDMLMPAPLRMGDWGFGKVHQNNHPEKYRHSFFPPFEPDAMEKS